VLGWQATKILWKSSAIYVLGMDSNWWQWTGSAWANVGPNTPGTISATSGGGATSADGTTVPTTAALIVDSAGAVWTIASNLLVLRNGASVLGWQTTKILWKSSTIYVLGMDSNWWQWSGSTWVNVGPTTPGTTSPTSGGGATSADGTTVPTTAAQIVDSAGAVWTIASNLLVLRNGASVLGWQTTKILWKSSTIYVLGMDSNWWQWTGSTWVNVGRTQP
jgi:hypothetical protein